MSQREGNDRFGLESSDTGEHAVGIAVHAPDSDSPHTPPPSSSLSNRTTEVVLPTALEDILRNAGIALDVDLTNFKKRLLTVPPLNEDDARDVKKAIKHVADYAMADEAVRTEVHNDRELVTALLGRFHNADFTVIPTAFRTSKTQELTLVGEQIGKGGAGYVFKARLSSGREVAVKIRMPDASGDVETARARFIKEGESQEKFGDAVPEVIDRGQVRLSSSTVDYIVMEYIDGPTLETVLKPYTKVPGKPRPYPRQAAIDLIVPILANLHAIHAKGEVHRDLKPANIMITKRGVVKIVDVGLLKTIGSNDGLTKQGTAVGTPDYMAPEMSDGGEIDQRTDIYALGVMLYEQMTGKLPYRADTTLRLLKMHGDPKVIPELPCPDDIDLQDCIMRMMAKDKTERPMSVKELLNFFVPRSSWAANWGTVSRLLEATNNERSLLELDNVAQVDQTLLDPGDLTPEQLTEMLEKRKLVNFDKTTQVRTAPKAVLNKKKAGLVLGGVAFFATTIAIAVSALSGKKDVDQIGNNVPTKNKTEDDPKDKIAKDKPADASVKDKDKGANEKPLVPKEKTSVEIITGPDGSFGFDLQINGKKRLIISPDECIQYVQPAEDGENEEVVGAFAAKTPANLALAMKVPQASLPPEFMGGFYARLIFDKKTGKKLIVISSAGKVLLSPGEAGKTNVKKSPDQAETTIDFLKQGADVKPEELLEFMNGVALEKARALLPKKPEGYAGTDYATYGTGYAESKFKEMFEKDKNKTKQKIEKLGLNN